MSNDLSITLESGGSSLVIAKGSAYRLIGEEGLGSGDFVVKSSENSALDGAYLQCRRIAARNITLVFESSDGSERGRCLLISFLNPKRSGTLTVRREGFCRSIGYEIAKVKYSQPTLFHPITVMLSLVCVVPFFSEPSLSADKSKRLYGLLAFPFNSLSGSGITAGYSTVRDSFYVDNTGDAEIGVRITLSVSGGNAEEPYIECEGKRVTVLGTLVPGDRCEICTEPGSKGIKLNGTARYNFDRSSIFFGIPAGRHLISFGASSGAEYLSAELSYRLRYLGI